LKGWRWVPDGACPGAILAGAGMTILLALAGCGSAPKKPEAAQPKYYSDDGPPEKVPDDLDGVPEAVPRDEAFNKFANRPYTVFGQTYAPVVNKEPFRQRGTASWYGRKFQGQKTASGEPYDMFKMTAAHKTLPIPSYARVTNVANGKSVVVRINDRGPFHSDRIIDLSYAAAARIGIAARGSGTVEVERVFQPTPAVASGSLPSSQPSPKGEGATAVPPAVLVTTPLAPPLRVSEIETPVVSQDTEGLWLQLGAFSSTQAAEIFRDKATGDLPWILEPIAVVERGGLYRVRLGPYRNRPEADAIAGKVRDSLGYTPSVVTQ
jgi:rare lipoprotein A